MVKCEKPLLNFELAIENIHVPVENETQFIWVENRCRRLPNPLPQPQQPYFLIPSFNVEYLPVSTCVPSI